MTSFVTLPAEARRALARRELRRRGLCEPYETEDEWMRRAAPEAAAAFDQISALEAKNTAAGRSEMPPEDEAEVERLMSLAVRSLQAAGPGPEGRPQKQCNVAPFSTAEREALASLMAYVARLKAEGA